MEKTRRTQGIPYKALAQTATPEEPQAIASRAATASISTFAACMASSVAAAFRAASAAKRAIRPSTLWRAMALEPTPLSTRNERVGAFGACEERVVGGHAGRS